MKLVYLVSLLVLSLGGRAFALTELETELADFQVQLQNDQARGKPGSISMRNNQKVHDKIKKTSLSPMVISKSDTASIQTTKRAEKSDLGATESQSADAELQVANTEAAIENNTKTNKERSAETTSESKANTSKGEQKTLRTDIEVEHTRGTFETHTERSPLIYRFSAVGLGSLSTFDGPDANTVISDNVGTPYNIGPSASMSADINLGSRNFVVEMGAQQLTIGSTTGYNSPTTSFYNYSTVQKVTLSYIGVPVFGKWLVSGEHQSSFFIKAGATPIFLTNSIIEQTSGYPWTRRLGEFNSTDVLLSVGGGYSLKLSNHFHVVVEANFYQGVISVSKYYDIFNTGATVGAGLSYLL